MTAEKNLKNQQVKYAEMLMQILEEFDKKLPVSFTLEDSVEFAIDAWNLANKKDFLMVEELYEKELKTYNKFPVFEEIVNYKVANFSESKNMIVDYSLIDDVLHIKCQTEEDYFNTIVKNMMDSSDEE